MNRFLVFIALFGLAAANPAVLVGGIHASQYRYQDELGQHAFGHVGGPNSREEVRTADGSTRGSYSYIDGNGVVQSAVYAADSANGFRVAATNLPAGPAVPGAATVAHVAAPAVIPAAAPIAAAPIAARLAYPSAILGAPVVHALKKRDVFAVSPLTSYPGSTAPLVHTAPVAHVATPVVAAPVAARLAYPSAILGAPVVHALKKRDVLAVSPLTSYPGSTAPLVHSAPVVAAPGAHVSPYVAHSYVAQPYVAHVLKKRAAVFAGPVVPADEPVVAHAKAAQLIQQNTEAIRNNFGGVPLALPADTPAVAQGKIAHAIAHANQAAVTSPLVTPFAARLAYPYSYFY